MVDELFDTGFTEAKDELSDQGASDMWIGLFGIVIAAAICFGVASLVMQPVGKFS
jgi:hypothetical protein